MTAQMFSRYLTFGRFWIIGAIIFAFTLISACDTVQDFAANSPAARTLEARAVAESTGSPAAQYPTATRYPTRTPGPTMTPVPPSDDARAEYYRGLYDSCLAGVMNDMQFVLSRGWTEPEQVMTYCNGFAASLPGWYERGSYGYRTPAP